MGHMVCPAVLAAHTRPSRHVANHKSHDARSSVQKLKGQAFVGFLVCFAHRPVPASKAKVSLSDSETRVRQHVCAIWKASKQSALPGARRLAVLGSKKKEALSDGTLHSYCP
jgi:hypothetical protein